MKWIIYCTHAFWRDFTREVRNSSEQGMLLLKLCHPFTPWSPGGLKGAMCYILASHPQNSLGISTKNKFILYSTAEFLLLWNSNQLWQNSRIWRYKMNTEEEHMLSVHLILRQLYATTILGTEELPAFSRFLYQLPYTISEKCLFSQPWQTQWDAAVQIGMACMHLQHSTLAEVLWLFS